MSKPTEEQIQKLLKNYAVDDAVFHVEFDKMLEEKLMELDPEWMKAMQKVYKDSRNERFY